MKINISLRVYAAYSRRLLYILYLIPCCTPDLQRAPTWKESANEIMERATLDRCYHFHGHSGMCAQLVSWFELFCFSSLPGRVLISVPRGLCQKYFQNKCRCPCNARFRGRSLVYDCFMMWLQKNLKIALISIFE